MSLGSRFFGSAKPIALPTTKEVFVVSFVYWLPNGEQGGGGFWWLPSYTPFTTAEQAFLKEAEVWKDTTARVRLVKMEVPINLYGEDLTDWIDLPENLEQIEELLPALRVSINGVYYGKLDKARAPEAPSAKEFTRNLSAQTEEGEGNE